MYYVFLIYPIWKKHTIVLWTEKCGHATLCTSSNFEKTTDNYDNYDDHYVSLF